MKQWKKVLGFLLTAAMTFTPAFSSIGAFDTVAAYAAPVTVSSQSVSVTVGTATMTYNDTQDLSITTTVSPNTTNVNWLSVTSSDESVVQIVEGSQPGTGQPSGWTIKAVGVGPAKVTAKLAAQGDVPESVASVDITVNQAVQTVTTVAVPSGLVVGSQGFTLSANTTGDGEISYAVTDGNAVKVDSESGFVTIEKAGTATITVTAAETANYKKGETNVEVGVGKGNQTITFDQPGNKKYGDAPFSLNADVSVGNGDLSYAVEAGDESYVGVDEDGLVTIKAPTNDSHERAAIKIMASGTDDYNAKTESVSFTIAKGEQEIDVATPVGKIVGDKFSLGAERIVGDGALSYASSDSDKATVDSKGEVEIKKAGQVTITVTAAATTNYAQKDEPVTFTAGQAEQEIKVTCGNPIVRNKGDEFVVLGATAVGDLTYTSSNTKVATVNSDGKVSFEAPGEATITIDAAATGDYKAAQLTIPLKITGSNKKTQTITTNPASPIEKTYGNSKFNLNAVASGHGDLTYVSNDTDIVTVDKDGYVQIVGAGEGSITISAAAKDEYDAATETIIINVKKATQAITIPGGSTIQSTYGHKPFDLNASTNGDGSLTFVTDNSSVATVDSEGTVTIIGAGKAKITVEASSTNNYEGTSKIVTVDVAKAEADIDAPTTIRRTVADGSFEIGAKIEGDGAVTYKSSNESVVTVDNTGLVTIHKYGNAVIDITVAESTNYTGASESVSIAIENSSKKTQTLTASDVTVVLGETATVVATSDATDVVTFTYESMDPTVATVDSKTGVVTPKTKGDTRIKIKASETEGYKAAETSVAVVVSKASQDLVIDQSYNPVGNVGFLTQTAGNTFKLNVTDPAKRVLTFTSSDDELNPINGGVVTIPEGHAKGAAFITIAAAESTGYEATTAFISLTIQATKEDQVITAADKTIAIGDTKALGATTNAAEDGAVLKYKSSDVDVVSVDSDGNVTGKKEGKAEITITADATDNYKDAEPKTITVTVEKATQKITGVSSTYSKAYGAKFKLNAKTSGDGKITYKSDKPKIAKVGTNNGQVQMMSGTGTTKITITAAETDTCKKATKTVTIKAKLATNPIVVKGKTANVSYTALQNKAQTVTNAKAYTIKNKKTKVTYAKSAGTASGFSVKSSNGAITVPKGKAKAKYKVNVLVKAAKNANYAAKNQKVTVTVQVK